MNPQYKNLDEQISTLLEQPYTKERNNQLQKLKAEQRKLVKPLSPSTSLNQKIPTKKTDPDSNINYIRAMNNRNQQKKEQLYNQLFDLKQVITNAKSSLKTVNAKLKNNASYSLSNHEMENIEKQLPPAKTTPNNIHERVKIRDELYNKAISIKKIPNINYKQNLEEYIKAREKELEKLQPIAPIAPIIPTYTKMTIHNSVPTALHTKHIVNIPTTTLIGLTALNKYIKDNVKGYGPFIFEGEFTAIPEVIASVKIDTKFYPFNVKHNEKDATVFVFEYGIIFTGSDGFFKKPTWKIIWFCEMTQKHSTNKDGSLQLISDSTSRGEKIDIFKNNDINNVTKFNTFKTLVNSFIHNSTILPKYGGSNRSKTRSKRCNRSKTRSIRR